MARNRKSYLQIIREKQNKTREVVAYEAGIDTSTLWRAEQNPANTKPDIMNMIIDSVGDEFAGYLYLSDNPVAMRFLPGGVERMDLLQAVVQLRSAMLRYLVDMEGLLDSAADGVISEDEMEQWIKSKGKLREILKAYIALECADGADK